MVKINISKKAIRNVSWYNRTKDHITKSRFLSLKLCTVGEKINKIFKNVKSSKIKIFNSKKIVLLFLCHIWANMPTIMFVGWMGWLVANAKTKENLKAPKTVKNDFFFGGGGKSFYPIALKKLPGSKAVTCSLISYRHNTRVIIDGSTFRAFGVPRFSPSSRSDPIIYRWTN